MLSRPGNEGVSITFTDDWRPLHIHMAIVFWDRPGQTGALEITAEPPFQGSDQTFPLLPGGLVQPTYSLHFPDRETTFELAIESRLRPRWVLFILTH